MPAVHAASAAVSVPAPVASPDSAFGPAPAPAAAAAPAIASAPAAATATGPAAPALATADAGAPADPNAACPRRTYVSLRLPVPAWREATDARGAAAWPPPGLAGTQVRLQLLGPGEGQVLFDSDNPARGGTAAASAPFALAEFRRLLLPGETLRVQREGSDGVLLEARGDTGAEEPASPWIDLLVRWLPVEGYDAPIESRSSIATRQGSYSLALQGDLRTVNRQLAAVATRLAGYVGAMLGAVLFVWLLLEMVVMRRIVLLTRRAAAVSDGMRAAAARGQPLNLTLEVRNLRGGDELGVLAQGLHDLLARVHADVEREQIRARQEREQWHAVGHEIVSPLQSLIALHGDAADPASRYLRRMQQAVRVLYGQASPSEAFASTQLALAPLDLDAFLATVAANAHHVGIEPVVYESPGQPLPVLADEHSLEDVVAHLLRNAERHREPGTAITLRAERDIGVVRASVHNVGAPVPGDLLPRVFDYGVSSATAAPAAATNLIGGGDHGDGAAAAGRRGQGLFVARTYMAKMGGTIAAHNVPGGVQFELTLPLAG
ncbi:MAG: HAMP domain-containing histidine kinase [Rubrivivax sp.]|nr:HAMP domain-containing histidine kinase [Rubrivivax sp.]